MNVRDALIKRRSVRKFKDTAVETKKINDLLHAGMSGPSACNKKPWLFYVVQNKETLKSLRKATMFSRMDAPLAIIVAGNKKKMLPSENADFWIEDCSAASENILLEATELGLGSCWIGVYPVQRFMKNVSQILELPENIIPLNILYLGYPDEFPEERDQYDESCVIYK